MAMISVVVPAPQDYDPDSYDDYDDYEGEIFGEDDTDYELFGDPDDYPEEDPEIVPRIGGCVNTIQDIEGAIFDGDTRQAFSDCEGAGTSCADWKDDVSYNERVEK